MSYFPTEPARWTFPIIELRQFDSGRNLRGTVFSKGLPNHEKIRRFQEDNKQDGTNFLKTNILNKKVATGALCWCVFEPGIA